MNDWVCCINVGEVGLVEQLIKNGASLDTASESNGWYPLHHAVNTSNVEVVKVLIKNGAKIDVQDQTFGRTPLNFAAQMGNWVIFDLKKIKYSIVTS